MELDAETTSKYIIVVETVRLQHSPGRSFYPYGAVPTALAMGQAEYHSHYPLGRGLLVVKETRRPRT